MDGKYFVAGVGLMTLGAIESIALYKGIDGAYLSACIGAISAIVGVAFGLKVGMLSVGKDVEVKEKED